MERIIPAYPFLRLGSLAFCMTLMCCGHSAETRQGVQHKSKVTEEGSFVIVGMMRYVDLEGGCWQLVTEENKAYELVGSDLESLHIEGLQVELQVKSRTGLNSFCQIGEIIEVLRILNVHN